MPDLSAASNGRVGVVQKTRIFRNLRPSRAVCKQRCWLNAEFQGEVGFLMSWANLWGFLVTAESWASRHARRVPDFSLCKKPSLAPVALAAHPGRVQDVPSQGWEDLGGKRSSALALPPVQLEPWEELFGDWWFRNGSGVSRVKRNCNSRVKFSMRTEFMRRSRCCLRWKSPGGNVEVLCYQVDASEAEQSNS